jgi:hypothetical protein
MMTSAQPCRRFNLRCERVVDVDFRCLLDLSAGDDCLEDEGYLIGVHGSFRLAIVIHH